MTQKRMIAVLSLSSSEPRLMIAGVEDGQVHIIRCESLSRSMLSLKLTIPAKLKKLREAGSVILVDEVVPHFAKYGRAIKLSDLDASGRPIIVAAMEAYNYLRTYGALIFPKEAGGRFDVSSSVVDEVRGTDGKTVYNIDWSELKPDTYALMFAVYASTQENILDVKTLRDLLQNLNEQQHQDSLDSRLGGIFLAREKLVRKNNDEIRKNNEQRAKRSREGS